MANSLVIAVGLCLLISLIDERISGSDTRTIFILVLFISLSVVIKWINTYHKNQQLIANMAQTIKCLKLDIYNKEKRINDLERTLNNYSSLDQQRHILYYGVPSDWMSPESSDDGRSQHRFKFACSYYLCSHSTLFCDDNTKGKQFGYRWRIH